MGKVLERKLMDRALHEAADAEKIVALVNEAINKTREIARGLMPMAANDGPLSAAMSQIASDVEDLFNISCRLECDDAVRVQDPKAATHLCHIAREAVNNAVRHGGARQITIALAARERFATLAIRDDGTGFGTAPNQSGMGLHIMRYRAGMIGGTLRIDRGGRGSTVVSCRFPLRRSSESGMEPA